MYGIVESIHGPSLPTSLQTTSEPPASAGKIWLAGTSRNYFVREFTGAARRRPLSFVKALSSPADSHYHLIMSPEVYRQLPNSLTVMRVFLAGAFFLTLNVYRYPDTNVAWANVALILFIAAAITDALDGHLARKWKAESLFGRLMDPFCDKVLIIGAFMYLTGPRFTVPEWVEQGSTLTVATCVYPWMVVVILARELLVTGIRGVIEGMGLSGASLWSGKAKMILQSIAIPIVLFLTVNFPPSEFSWAYWSNNGLVYLTVIVTVWSGLPYVAALQKLLSEQKKAKDPTAAVHTAEKAT